MKIHVVSLGCDKNLVDSEAMIGLMRDGGHEFTMSAEEADAIIVNTCGFIASASREGIRVILEMAEYKENSRCRFLVVTGCMAQRYKDEIFKELPEVDAVIGLEEMHRIGDILPISGSAEEKPCVFGDGDFSLSGAYLKRTASTMGFAYLKIAEGCDNRCSYCTIPSIKGRYRSRPIENVLEEAKSLAAQGVRELVLVAQDTTLYGSDFGKAMLPELLRKLSEIESIAWIRILYAYPERLTQEIIDEMASNPKVCHYIDMPIQHSSASILKRMGRGETKLRSVIEALRSAMPDIAVRTTLIAGFPGETEEEFKGLVEFIKEIRFDRLGVFAYSREEGTPAADMPNQIDEKVKAFRLDKLMKIQKKISMEKNKMMIGKTLDVIVDGRIADDESQDGRAYCARSYRDCYELDGMVFFNSFEEFESGAFVRVEVTGSGDYDLYARLI
ncbi:MAG: 30S ribosomal protein S12 methylthiotransferase RimO [Clostridiales bacterium]|jgi:ribosomal protein S12 methylthiotransferase|nr:30S ribosomal protein S12 methylthiotransferase RimO [Clostridiales bacterium]